MSQARRIILMLALVGSAFCAACTHPSGEAATTANAVTVFGGRMTDNDFGEVLIADDIGWRQTGIAGAAYTRTLDTFWDGGSVEVEGQVVRHFGDQDHWEVNALATGRWSRFPWSESLHTSIAWGLGPSFASEIPAEELAVEGTSRQVLVYWMGEVEIGPPNSRWSLIARLHHRSTGFGLLGEDGGGNWVVGGFRWRF